MKKTSLLSALALVLLNTPARARGQEAVFPNIGNRLPPLEFQSLTGFGHRLDWSSPEKKTAVIFFFEPRCADCFREFVFFDSVSRLARGMNLEIFAVEGSGQETREVEAAISRYVSIFQQPAFTVVSDPSYSLSSLLNVRTMPSTFLVTTQGVVLSRKEGFDDFHAIDLTRKMERLLGAGKGEFSAALASLGISGQDELAFERGIEERRKAGDSGTPYEAPLAAGSQVAPFDFTDIAGGRGRWVPEAGKATVVFFWGALCQPCISEMAYLEQLRSFAGGDSLTVIAVEGTGLAAERVSQVMERYEKFHPPPSYPIVADPERLLSRQFGVSGALPKTFIIGGDGQVLSYTDEFVIGGERRLADKIGRALGLDGGFLLEEAARAASSSRPSPAGESPTVLRNISGRKEEFAASLVEAETLHRNFQYSAAIPHYQRCLEIDPQSVVVRERLGEIYQRQGELLPALEQWQKVLELDPGHTEAARRVEKLRKSVGPESPEGD